MDILIIFIALCMVLYGVGQLILGVACLCLLGLCAHDWWKERKSAREVP